MINITIYSFLLIFYRDGVYWHSVNFILWATRTEIDIFHKNNANAQMSHNFAGIIYLLEFLCGTQLLVFVYSNFYLPLGFQFKYQRCLIIRYILGGNRDFLGDCYVTHP